MKKRLEASTRGVTATRKSPTKVPSAKKAVPSPAVGSAFLPVGTDSQVRATVPRIGVHVSVAGGLENAFANAAAARCDCIQIFVKNQRQWRAKPLQDEQITAFFEAKATSAVHPVIAHASYLLNLAAPSEAVRELSMNSMVDEMVRCEAFGVEGLVFHPGAHCEGEVRNPFGHVEATQDGNESRSDPGGSDEGQPGKEKPVRNSKFEVRKRVAKHAANFRSRDSDRKEFGEHMLAGIERIARGMDEVAKRCAGFRTKFFLECTAGQGSAIGWQFEQLAEILKRVRDPARVGVCLDTCHLFAAGYDFRKPDGYAAMIDRLDGTIGIAQVKCIHCNDSKRELGSRVDRHDHIGKGQIGKSGFANFLSDPRFREVPFILETPKEKDEKGRDWDVLNVKMLRSLIRQ